jgi:predicted Zn-dependent protease
MTMTCAACAMVVTLVAPATEAFLPAPRPVLAHAEGAADAADQNRNNSRRDRDEKEKVVAQQQEETYRQLVEYAEGLYNDDKRPFKAQVDKQYQQLMRAHAERAFQTNVSAKSEMKFILEDRMRLYEGLYDNLLIQDVVNRLGQKVAPKPSKHLYAFKLIADPVPRAETLATGTIYISTGLVSLLQNEAQLAYVLAHEAAHVHRNHWFNRIQLDTARPIYEQERQKNANASKGVKTWLGSIAGASIGAAVAGKEGAAIGALAGAGTTYAVASVLEAKNEKQLTLDWFREEEDEADELAFNSLLDAGYNVRQIPNLYTLLADVARQDERASLGFLGNPQRVTERHERAEALIAGAQAKMQGKSLIGDGPEFKTITAELKRDNGILAYHYDMLEMARNNLRDAVSVRDTDPSALYYYAKVLKLVGQTDKDRDEAFQLFARAIENDRRNQNFGAYLHRATTLLESEDKGRRDQAAVALRTYVEKYLDAQMENRRAGDQNFPPHLETIYDYLNRVGDRDWVPSATRTVSGPAPASRPASAVPAPPPAPPRRPVPTSGTNGTSKP